MLVLAITSLASADDLPWECPAVTLPADATVYRDTDGGLEDSFDALYDAAYAWWPASCVWVETTTITDDSTLIERVCEADGATVAWSEYAWDEYDYTTVSVDTWSLAVTVDTGESWSSIELSLSESAASGHSSAGRAEEVRTAAWTGSFDGLPDDGWFTTTSGTNYSRGLIVLERAVETPACAFEWSHQWEDYIDTETVVAPDHTVAVENGTYLCVEAWITTATVDRVLLGAADRTTWALDPNDTDADGHLPASDCDDTDPTVHPCAREVMDDGIDQDCDGADRTSGGGDTGDTGADTGDTDADTGDTDTGDTDADTGDTDTGDTDSGDTDSGDTDSGDTDSGDTDSGDTDTGDTDSGDTDTGDTDSGPDTARSFSPRPDPEVGCGGRATGAAWLLLLPLALRRRPSR